MQFLLLLFVFLFQLNTLLAADKTIHLELGEDYLIPSSGIQKIWIENKKVLRVETLQNQESKHSNLRLKTLNIGYSYFRIKNELRIIYVHPLGTLMSNKYWQKNKLKNMEVHFCGLALCAYGELDNLKTYIQLLTKLEYQKVPLFFAFTTAHHLKTEIKNYIEQQIRAQGLTPQKLQLSGVWRMFVNKKNSHTHLKNLVKKLGVELVYSEQVLDQYDNIETTVQIVEINKNYLKKIGLTWPSQFQSEIVNFNSLKAPANFQLALNAAENKGIAKILASPKIVCRSGHEADFFAGGEFPVKISNLRTNRIEWKKYGISLKLKPQIDPFGQLNLQIDTEISSVDHSLKVDDLPAVHLSRVSSFFDVINNKTISLSGLVRSEIAENSEGLPFLQSIPILGELFKSKNFLQNKTELVIFVTPRLIKTESEQPL